MRAWDACCAAGQTTAAEKAAINHLAEVRCVLAGSPGKHIDLSLWGNFYGEGGYITNRLKGRFRVYFLPETGKEVLELAGKFSANYFGHLFLFPSPFSSPSGRTWNSPYMGGSWESDPTEPPPAYYRTKYEDVKNIAAHVVAMVPIPIFDDDGEMRWLRNQRVLRAVLEEAGIDPSVVEWPKGCSVSRAGTIYVEAATLVPAGFIPRNRFEVIRAPQGPGSSEDVVRVGDHPSEKNGKAKRKVWLDVFSASGPVPDGMIDPMEARRILRDVASGDALRREKERVERFISAFCGQVDELNHKRQAVGLPLIHVEKVYKPGHPDQLNCWGAMSTMWFCSVQGLREKHARDLVLLAAVQKYNAQLEKRGKPTYTVECYRSYHHTHAVRWRASVLLEELSHWRTKVELTLEEIEARTRALEVMTSF